MERMKKSWGSPKMEIQMFMPQEYAAACGDVTEEWLIHSSLINWALHGDVYYDTNKNGILDSTDEQCQGLQTGTTGHDAYIDTNGYLHVKNAGTPGFLKDNEVSKVWIVDGMRYAPDKYNGGWQDEKYVWHENPKGGWVDVGQFLVVGDSPAKLTQIRNQS